MNLRLILFFVVNKPKAKLNQGLNHLKKLASLLRLKLQDLSRASLRTGSFVQELGKREKKERRGGGGKMSLHT